MKNKKMADEIFSYFLYNHFWNDYVIFPKNKKITLLFVRILLYPWQRGI